MADKAQPKSIIVRLCLFAAICGAALAAIYELTRDRIETAAAEARLAALHALLTPGAYDNDLLQSRVEVANAAGEPVVAYRATRHGKLVRVLFQSSSRRGYSGPIDLLVAFDGQGLLRGARVVKHRETPGLGDVIEAEKSDWVTQFYESPASGSWKLSVDGGEFDAVTGATVSSRAVAEALEQASWIYTQYRDVLTTGLPDA